MPEPREIDAAPPLLKWEQVHPHDEPGDQAALSWIGNDHGYWSLGPDKDGWNVELITRDPELNEVVNEHTISLGWYASESGAKADAEAYELKHGRNVVVDFQVATLKPGDTIPIIGRFVTMAEALAFLAGIEYVDPEAVYRGDFGISAPEAKVNPR